MISDLFRLKVKARRMGDPRWPTPYILIQGDDGCVVIYPDFGKLDLYVATGKKRNRKRSVGPFWVGYEDQAALVDIEFGKVHAYVWRDGSGKCYPTVYVSPFRALQIARAHQGFLVSLLSLPRCAMELLRLRSMDDAQACVQRVLEGGS